ncbi:MAG: hypothetical protein RRY29_01605, partial [Desulfovibrionaceae bacterium]
MSMLSIYISAGKFFFGIMLFFSAFLWVSPVFAEGAASLEAQTSTSQNSKGSITPPARHDSFLGTGNSSTGGFSSTYTDPQTGDVITRVIPPAPQNTQQTPVPIFVYPQVEPQWPPKNNAQPRPVPPPRPVPDPYSPRPPSNPSLY